MPRIIKTGLILSPCLLALFWLSQHVFLFAAATVFVSLFIFGKIESDRNQHDWHFYVQKEHYTSSAIRLLRAYGKVEVVVRSLVVGVVAAILFSGSNDKRLEIVRCIFLGSVVLTLLLLVFCQWRFHLVGSRWAYVRGSVIAGVIFSTSLAIFGPVVGFNESLKGSLTILEESVRDAGGFSAWLLSQVASTPTPIERWAQGTEAINLITQFVPKIMTSLLDLVPFVPTTLARILATLLSINIFYGLIVLPYSMILMRLLDSNFLKSPQPQIRQPKDNEPLERSS
jgi:hypothetical protein